LVRPNQRSVPFEHATRNPVHYRTYELRPRVGELAASGVPQLRAPSGGARGVWCATAASPEWGSSRRLVCHSCAVSTPARRRRAVEAVFITRTDDYLSKNRHISALATPLLGHAHWNRRTPRSSRLTHAEARLDSMTDTAEPGRVARVPRTQGDLTVARPGCTRVPTKVGRGAGRDTVPRSSKIRSAVVTKQGEDSTTRY
jgi:hypothetical protein